MTKEKKMTIVSATAATAILAAIIAGAAATALVGCDRVENCSRVDENAKKSTSNAWTYHGRECSTKVIEIEGHKYIIMDGYYSGNIIHAASCQCMTK